MNAVVQTRKGNPNALAPNHRERASANYGASRYILLALAGRRDHQQIVGKL